MRRIPPLVAIAAAALVLASSVAAAASDPGRAQQWNLDVIGASRAWQVADGDGVVVAVVDSGVDLDHEDLAGQLVRGFDVLDRDHEPRDTYGHGTHVAGIVAAATGNGRGIEGVAPGAKIMPIRVLDESGSGTIDHVVEGVRWAVANGAKVINLSLGEDTQAIFGPRLSDVIREAWEAGAVPVVSAGNQFVTGSGFADEPALVVAATTRSDGKPTYSSGVGRARWGIAAPGGELPDLGPSNAVLSSYWTRDGSNEYAWLAGTSQAAPHVAGAVAVLLSTGRFTPQQAVDRLLATAVDVGPPGRDDTFGAGRLDLAAATAGLAPAPPAAPAPPPTTAGSRPARPAPGVTAGSPAPAPPGSGQPSDDEPVPLPPSTAGTTPTPAPDATVHVPEGNPVVVDELAAPGGDDTGDDTGDDEAPAAVAAGVLAAAVAAAAWRQRRLVG